MDIDNILTERKAYIDSALAFLETERKTLNRILESLNLTPEELLKTEKKQVCPYNSNHIMPETALKRHIENCKLLTSGCQRDELPTLLQNLDYCYENTDSILKIELDEKLLNKIIWDYSIANGQVYTGHRNMPVSLNDDNIMLTQEDRLAIYQYVVRVSHEAGKVIPVDRNDDLLTTDWGSLVKKGLLDEQNNKQYSSKLEQLAALRDMKRRRQSYRAKNVHITKKSYTEIIREVISNQMEILMPEGNKEPRKYEQDNTDLLPQRNETNFESSKREHNDRGQLRDIDRRRRDRSQDILRSKSRDRSRSREKNRSRHYHTSKDNDKFRRRDRSRDKSRNISRECDRLRERAKGRKRSRDRSKSKERHRQETKHVVKIENFSISCGSSINDDQQTVPMPIGDIKTEIVEEEERTKSSNLTIIEVDVNSKEKPSLSDSDSDTSEKHSSKYKKHKHKKKHSKRKKHKNRD